MAKLSDKQKKEIVAMFVETQNKSAVARKFGVSVTTVANIINAEVEILEKMKKVDEEMRKCNYDLDKLKDLYDNTEEKKEKQLLFAEIRSIEISNSIIIDKND